MNYGFPLLLALTWFPVLALLQWLRPDAPIANTLSFGFGCAAYLAYKWVTT
jgi:hypothetical protein